MSWSQSKTFNFTDEETGNISAAQSVHEQANDEAEEGEKEEKEEEEEGRRPVKRRRL